MIRRPRRGPIVWALLAEVMLAAAVLAVAAFGLAPGLARAGDSSTGKSSGDKSDKVERVRIGRHGIIVERGAHSDTLEPRDRNLRTRIRSYPTTSTAARTA